MVEDRTGVSPSPVGQESMEFREVQQLLPILAHSLYAEREIFLRELVSNASDALNRLQFEMLTNREVLEPEAELAIRIQVDESAQTIAISDTGIGMTREELIQDLGAIAHSGAMAFLQHGEVPQKILELNRGHSLIQNLARLLAQSPAEALIDIAIQLLFDNALLLEGLHPHPADMVPRIRVLMEATFASLTGGSELAGTA